MNREEKQKIIINAWVAIQDYHLTGAKEDVPPALKLAEQLLEEREIFFNYVVGDREDMAEIVEGHYLEFAIRIRRLKVERKELKNRLNECKDFIERTNENARGILMLWDEPHYKTQDND